MNGTFRKMLRSPWRALPVPVRSRLLGLAGSQGAAQEAAATDGTLADKFRSGIPTLPGLLEHIRENGFAPFAIVDIGANVGDWSRTASSIFVSSRILMFDGDPDNEPALHNTVREIGSRSEYFLCLLGPEKKEKVTFYRPDAGTTGSSILPELTSFEKDELALPMDTLDSL